MNLNICNNCGGAYEYQNGRWCCRYCGSLKPEQISNEEVTLLYTAFQKLRLAEFDEAEKEFDDIVRRYPENPNAYWGRLMAHYGIKYEEDFDGRRIPSCYATSIHSILDASDYKNALKYADADMQKYFKKQAKYIEDVRRVWVEKAKKEEPYDIFICYKESDQENGNERTRDSQTMQGLYTHLTKKGYRVFFARESLSEKTGEKYEPYIFNALSTAKVMIVYGSKPEYITSTWMKNEWTRFEKRIHEKQKKEGSLIVAYDGFSPSDLPAFLASKQCIKANSRSFYSDIDDAVDRIIHDKYKDKTDRANRRKARAPLLIAVFLLMIALSCVLTWHFLEKWNEGPANGIITTVTNGKHGFSIVADKDGFGENTELRVEEVTHDANLDAIVRQLPVKNDNYHMFDMELSDGDHSLSLNDKVTVTMPVPDGISVDRVYAYDMGGEAPEKIEIEIINGKIVFVTSELSFFLIAEGLHAYGDHTAATRGGIAPSCTANGWGPETYCSVCGEVLSASSPLPAKGHTPGAEATCTTPQFCADCATVLHPANGHRAGAEATCSSGQTCEICHIVLVPAKPHTYGEWETVKNPIAGEDGLRVQKCTVCGTKLGEEIIPGKDASEGLEFSSNGDGTYTLTGMGTCTDTNVVIPSVYNGGAVTVIGEKAFFGNKKLQSVSIPGSVKCIGEFAFGLCSGMTDVEIAEGVETLGMYAFWECSSLTNVVLPDSVTTFDGCVFRNCTDLQSVTIGKNVKKIEYWGFERCVNLRSIYYLGTVAQWNTVATGHEWDAYIDGGYTVYCVDGTVVKEGITS